MAWPRRRAIWGEDIQEVKQDYARLARTIARFEALVMVAHPEDADEARQAVGPAVQVREIPIDDSWTRDSGPIFVIDESGSLVASLWRFNAWGDKYQPHDQECSARAARCRGARCPRHPIGNGPRRRRGRR